MRRATDDLHAVLTQVGDVERRLVVLDFDGTLSPIIDDPDAARLAPGAAEAIRSLAQRTTVALLTGRAVDDARSRLGDLDVAVLGGHGAEVQRADGSRVQLLDPAQVAETVTAVRDELESVAGDVRGAWVETKPHSVAVHYRKASPSDTRRLLPQVHTVLRSHLEDGDGWRVLQGRQVIELRPLSIDKGRALRWFAHRHPGQLPLVVGDDVADEDAFQAANELGGCGILVARSPRHTAARWRLDGPDRVVELVRGLSAPPRERPTVELSERRDRRSHPIGSYGMIGDSRSAALVSPDGSVDWFCTPRFDSPSVFAALLDPVRGGRFRVRPAQDGYQVQRTYLAETNVLVTRFVRDGNPFLTLTDFLVYSRVNARDPGHTGHLLIRRLQAFADVEVELEFQPRFDYGRVHTAVERTERGLRASAGSDWVDLVAPWLDVDVVDHEDGNGGVGRGTFALVDGDERWLRMRTTGADRGPHAHLDEPDLLDLTVRTWGRWAGMIDYEGPWREHVVRSALVLKGLVYEPTGALVAAPTTSLPEHLGGERNWDYRYSWIRDSAYVLETFLRVGHTQEAETFIRWLGELLARIGGAHSLRPLYRVTGEEDLTEFELDHLSGYADSRPVRIGNGAATQLQLDIYGAAMQLGYLTEQLGQEVPASGWPTIVDMVETVAQRWEEPDAGLWEIRSPPRHHTFSKFQCWLAVDRAIRIGRGLGLEAPYDRWQQVADDIQGRTLAEGYDDELGAFTQAFGSAELDASILLLPLRGFVPPRDHRVRGTVEAIRRELEVADGLLLRYRTTDGLAGEEGAFLMCSFWLIELLARMGELDEAVRLFERLLSLGGPLGLYAEEVDPDTHEHLGNFPQGFTHMGLIGAATAIHEELQNRDRTLAALRSREGGATD